MPASRSPAQQATARANGARSHGPTTDAGRTRSGRNGTTHGLRGGPFALLPSEDREAFAELHAAVTADRGPRDPYERRWVMELVAAMWRQDRLRCLELVALTAATGESPPGEATLKKLATFARYGSRIDRDIGRALQALRVLRNRLDAWIEDAQHDTPEPEPMPPQASEFPNDLPPRTRESGSSTPPAPDPMLAVAARTLEPEPAPPLNRHQRRRLQALARKQRHAA